MDTGLIGRLEPADAAADRRGGRRAPRRSRCALAARAGDDPFDAPRRLAPRRRARAVLLEAARRRRRAARRRARRDVRARVWTALHVRARRRELWLAHDGWTWHVHRGHGRGRPPRARRRRAARADARARCCWCRRSVGDAVEAGQTVVVLESMKMELVAGRAGRRHRDRAAACRWATRSAATRSSRRWRPHDATSSRPTPPTTRRWRRTCASSSRACGMGGGEKARARHTGARQAAPARARRPPARQGRAVPRALAAGRARHVRRRRAGRGDRHRRRPRQRAASA